ncbi:MAG: hypothetical protein ACW967_09035 [Candidatus Hodarchaeales archaeon]|jgi:hypothetical protein
MSTSETQNESKSGKDPVSSKKEITFNIREDVISKQFILRSIKAFIQKNEDFKEDIMVKSPMGDSMIMTIEKGDKKIVVSTKHDNDITLNIKGDPELLKKFIHDITLEAVATVASQFTGCVLKAKKPDFDMNIFHNNLQKYLHHALHKAVEDSLAEAISFTNQ